MINPKSKRYVASGISGSTGEKALIVEDSGQLAKVIIGQANTSGDTADIVLYDSNNTTIVNKNSPSNIIARLDGNCVGEYDINIAFHTGLVYEVSGDYAAGGAPKFTIVWE